MSDSQHRFMDSCKWFILGQMMIFAPISAAEPCCNEANRRSIWECYDQPPIPHGCTACGNNEGYDCSEAALCLDLPLEDCEGHPTHVDPGLGTYEIPECGGIWLPEDPVLFRPFMADPRQIVFSAGWRFNDDVLAKNVIDVSFGDSIAIYRWCDVWPWNGELQIDIEGALWACFDPLAYSSPLMNADYYGGVPITYATDNWEVRLRLFHISSHLGDEFLLNHPGFDRRNPSAEYLDFFISHDFTDEIRLYAGLGYILAQDKEFPMDPFYSAIGAELRLLSLGFTDKEDRLYGCPIYAMHFRQNGDFKHHIDSTFILGYEFGKVVGLCRKLRFFMEYHDGYSCEGQFSKYPTNYFSVRTTYGF